MMSVGSLPFVGTIRVGPGVEHPDRTGHYRWLDAETPEPRVSGTIDVISPGNIEIQFDPVAVFGVGGLRGRVVEIEIPGVGRFPARLYWESPSRAVEFHGWCRPVPIAGDGEIVDQLRTPIHDALIEAGHPELADMVRAAAVALGGWPEAPRWTRADAEREAETSRKLDEMGGLPR